MAEILTLPTSRSKASSGPFSRLSRNPESVRVDLHIPSQGNKIHLGSVKQVLRRSRAQGDGKGDCKG